MTNLPIEIQAGDLITADFMTDILGTLKSLEDRVAILEQGSVDEGAVFITGWMPPIPRPGEKITIIGRNFEFLINAHKVYLDAIPIISFEYGSNTTLVFNVPDTLNIPVKGRDVNLTVSNSTSSTIIPIFMLPKGDALQGNVDVDFTDEIIPNPIEPNQSAIIGCMLTSRALSAADFLIQPEILTWSGIILRVLDGQQQLIPSNLIHLEIGEEKAFYIEIEQIPPGTENTFFTLTVTASTDGVSGARSIEIEVGEFVEPSDETITVNPSGFDPEEAFDGSEISLHENQMGTMTLDATFTKVPGEGEIDYYDISLTLAEGTENWTAVLFETPNAYELDAADFIEGEANETPQFRIRPNEGATQSGTIIFRIQRRGADLSETLLFSLRVP